MLSPMGALRTKWPGGIAGRRGRSKDCLCATQFIESIEKEQRAAIMIRVTYAPRAPYGSC